jgi:transposase
MLCEKYYQVRLSEFDEEVFQVLVPPNHYLRRALKCIAWGNFYEILAPYYSADEGRPAESPVLMLKLEYLRYHDNLSDRQVIGRAETDGAYRYFLQIGVREPLPNPSSLCYFRGRLGCNGFRRVFQQLIHEAREHGLVKDRLRIKDASHVIANIAVPSTLALIAQTRDKLLTAAEPFDPIRVEGERVNIELLRESTAGQKDEQRLVTRVTHLRDILAWADELKCPENADQNGAWQSLVEQRRLAHKILADQQNPEGGDRTLSTVDPDARRGKHGQWYDGYMVDVIMDADSELITEINVLPANGDEASDAGELIRQEEEAHGNDVEALSMDKAGFNGAVLRELEDPEGLAVNTFVPPKKEAPSTTFTPQDFTEDPEHRKVTCPAGETSDYRQRDKGRHGWMFRFKRGKCEGCSQFSDCIDHSLRGPFGRTVRKTDYEAEYRRAREKATTAEYEAVRSEHPKVERKLGEMLNRHGGRRARYCGRGKVLVQELMAAMATDVKRIVRLLCARTAALECEF